MVGAARSASSRRFVAEDGRYGEFETGATTLSFASHDLGKANLPTASFPRSRRPDRRGRDRARRPDVPAAIERAVEAGARELSPPKQKPWGQTVSYVRDPNGVLIELAPRSHEGAPGLPRSPHPAPPLAGAARAGRARPRRQARQAGRPGVESIRERWIVEEGWWTDAPVRRAYVELVLADGGLAVVFEDLVGGGWHRHTSASKPRREVVAAVLSRRRAPGAPAQRQE